MVRQKTIKPRVSLSTSIYCMAKLAEIIDSNGNDMLSPHQLWFSGTMQIYGNKYKYLSVKHAEKIKDYCEQCRIEFDADLTGFMPDGVTPYGKDGQV